MQTVHFLGIPEGDLALVQLTIYLALAPKSDASYQAFNRVNSVIEGSPAFPVPLHLRNAPTDLMKQMDYGKGYQHAHQEENAVPGMQCLPDSLAGSNFYAPTDRGFEQKLRERLEWLKNNRKKSASTAD
jgi:putative ATPase